MTIENSGATFFYLATTTETNWYKFHVDGSSHCLDHSGTTLTVSNCTAGDDGQKWFATLEGTGQGCFFTPRDNLSATIHTYSEDDAKPLWVNNDTQLVFRDYTTALFTGC